RRRAGARGMGKSAIGIVGVGNCASSLLQGIEFYRAVDEKTADAHVGLMHHDVCGYHPSDIEVVCAFDVDQRKVGQPLDVAALAPPNNTRPLYPKLPRSSVIVEMGPVLDGVAEHMSEYPPEEAFVVAERRPADVVEVLERSGAEMDRTYQLNTGGNTDFLNMLNRARTGAKRLSKTEAVQSVLPSPLPRTRIHIGPSDYVPWQRDNKVCFLRMEGRGFANAPLE